MSLSTQLLQEHLPKIQDSSKQNCREKRGPKHNSIIFISLASHMPLKIEIRHEDSNIREVSSFLDCKDQNHLLLSSKNTSGEKKRLPLVTLFMLLKKKTRKEFM